MPPEQRGLLIVEENGDPVRPPTGLSPSAISTFHQCPLKFRLSKIDKIKEEPSIEALQGTFIHEVFEVLYKQPPERRTLDRARQITASLWGKYRPQVEELGVVAEAQRQFRWRVWWAIENLFQMEDPSTIEPEGLEEFITGKVGNITVRGIIDRYQRTLSGRLAVVDYKSGKLPRKREWGGEDAEIQISTYIFLAEQKFRTPVAYGELLYVADGKRVRYVRDGSRIAKMIAKVKSTWDELLKCCDSGSFEARPSKLCDWCSYKPICPVWQQRT